MTSHIHPQDPVDLTNCDKEPIHIPGCIQPHGLLLVVDPTDLKIVQVSANSLEQIDYPTEALLGVPLSNLIDEDEVKQICNHLLTEERQYTRPIYITLHIRGKSKIFASVVHRNLDGLFIIEMETPPSQRVFWPDFYEMLRLPTIALQNVKSLRDMSQMIAQEIKRLTTFDRVMVYQFDDDGHGEVIAEMKQPNVEPYLGLHYPASDIPKQARRLYVLNWLRLIRDIHYQPVDIVPTLNPITGQPLDLTFTFLRSVSPIHIEYLKNMGVGASMSISLIKDGQLWGLIACHHYSPIEVSYEVRTACEFLGQIFSLQLGNKQESQDHEYDIKVKLAQLRCVERVTIESNFVDGLFSSHADLLAMCRAQGAALCFDHRILLVGETPDEDQVDELLEWLKATEVPDIFHTPILSQYYPPALDFKNVASGLIAAAVSSGQRNYILWFRPEVLQTVDWAGNPEKAVEKVDDGTDRLSPRKSFALWQQTLENYSLPWQGIEIEAVAELRDVIIESMLRTMEKLSVINAELERSNSELDEFAYIASHDLKEPLRGLHNYASFLMEDYQDKLDEEGVSKLKTLVRLTQRMEDLINSLLHFSRVGRVDFSMRETSLNDLVLSVIDILNPRLQSSHIEIRIPRPLPNLMVDAIRTGEVFNNLITNAIKYNDKINKWIEIGYVQEENAPTVFYVRDNGIGIREKHFETIFRIFKRLHTRDEYGGGTGSGLTIARKIVERHKGRLWIESKYGEGSTFYFTLESDKKLL